MATGVLIVGIGRGTKGLQNFLDCTKTYETVVLFGKSTDTYDIAGKVVATAGTDQISKSIVEEKLEGFRGSIQQIPPIYSALKIDGMKAYDYARSGKEMPRELASRTMTVSECTLIQWYAAGEHDFRWPAEELPQTKRDLIQSLAAETPSSSSPANLDTTQDSLDSVAVPSSNKTGLPEVTSSPNTSALDVNSLSREDKAKLHTHEIVGLDKEPANAPAVRVKLTVSSGFYVRSFANDLGIACGSYGTMAELARTRQADFSSSNPAPDGLIPALDHADLAKGEEAWGPKITKILQDWVADHPAQHNLQRQQYERQNISETSRNKNSRKRRNSSSPEC